MRACYWLSGRVQIGVDQELSGRSWRTDPLPIRPLGRDAFAIKRDRLLPALPQAHDGIVAQPRLRARDRRASGARRQCARVRATAGDRGAVGGDDELDEDDLEDDYDDLDDEFDETEDNFRPKKGPKREWE